MSSSFVVTGQSCRCLVLWGIATAGRAVDEATIGIGANRFELAPGRLNCPIFVGDRCDQGSRYSDHRRPAA